jgi:hypothetical protein
MSSSVARWSIAEVKVELLTPSAAQGLTWSDEVAHRSGLGAACKITEYGGALVA